MERGQASFIIGRRDVALWLGIRTSPVEGDTVYNLSPWQTLAHFELTVVT